MRRHGCKIWKFHRDVGNFYARGDEEEVNLIEREKRRDDEVWWREAWSLGVSLEQAARVSLASFNSPFITID